MHAQLHRKKGEHGNQPSGTVGQKNLFAELGGVKIPGESLKQSPIVATG